MLGEAETTQLTLEWNDTAMGHVELVADAFGRHSVVSADAVAIVWEDERIAYGELGRRVDRLAAHLSDLGVGPDTAVGLWAERTPEVLIGMLAIWRAGGCYLPIDPSTNETRLAQLIETAQVSCLNSLNDAGVLSANRPLPSL